MARQGSTFSAITIRACGSLSAKTPTTITPATGIPIIAPFWADVDTRVGQTKPPPFFDQVLYDVDSVNGVFTATWDQVGYYREHTDPTNSFQLQLISLGNGDFDIVFRYQSIGWTTGDASEGKDGLGGLVARAGYSADTGKSTDFFELPQSGNQDAMLGLPSASNRGIPGVFVFNVANAATVSIAALSAAKAEGNSGTTPFTFAVSLSQADGASHSVGWAVTGSGVHPANAADFGGALPTLAPGETSKVLTVGVSGDTTVEPDEGFTVTLGTPSSGVTIGTGSATGIIQNDDTAAAPVHAHDDAYVLSQDHGLTAGTGSSVLVNDDNAATASLGTGPSHGSLHLGTDGSFDYAPTPGFAGIDRFSYHASNGGSAADAQALLYVVPTQGSGTPTLNLLVLNAEEQIAATYTAFFSRGADAVGFNFWVGEFTAGKPTHDGAATIANIANSFGVSDEAKALHPFLANPQGASSGQISGFLDTVYNNLFNRSSDPAGLAYWTGQIQQAMAGGRFMGSVLVDIISGSQIGPDVQTLMGKVAVGLEFVHQQDAHGKQWSGASDNPAATTLLHAVTSDPQSVLIGIKQADALVAAHA